MNLTIVIPTKNRFDYIKKIINYYEHYSFKGKIYFLDSSDKNIFIKTKKCIKKNGNKNFYHFRGIGTPFECGKSIAGKIKTKYMCWSGDDDYFIISGLEQSIKILNKQRKINALNGKTITASLKRKFLFFRRYSIYENFYSEQKKPIERLRKILNDYRVPFWCVFRSKVFKKTMKYVPSKSKRNLCPTRIINDEILESLLFAYFTKIYKFEFPLFIRTVPEKKYATKSARSLNKAKNFTKDQKKSLNYVSNVFVNLLETSDERKQFRYEFNKFVKKIKIQLKNRHLIARGIKFKLRKIFTKFMDKDFKIFIDTMDWLMKN